MSDPHRLTLSRAARLAGVTRAELQGRIRRGEIPTFEGAVAVSDLLRLYPAIHLGDDRALEQVERLKRESLPKRDTVDAALPEARVLLARLRELSASLAERVAAVDATMALLTETGARLDTLASLEAAALPDAIRTLRDWFDTARDRLASRPDTESQVQLIARDSVLRIMAAQVQIIPSGHDFFVEGNESLLDAAVRAGLRLSYGCSSGNCGACKVRLVSGETWKIRDHDYVIGAREKQLGYLLACSHTAVTDVVLEAAEARSPAELPRQEIRASPRRSERLSDELALLLVQTPRTQTLRFMAGQRVRLTLEDGASRELPVASCPCNGRQLWFLVRRGTDDFGRAILDRPLSGQAIQISGPLGQFVLVEDAPEPAVFIAFGDGIAPIKSLIEHFVSIDRGESCQLYWDAVAPEGHHQGQWARALRDALDNFSYTLLANGQADAVLAAVRADRPDPGGRRFYVAGPEPLARDCAAGLQDWGVPPAWLAVEYTDS